MWLVNIFNFQLGRQQKNKLGEEIREKGAYRTVIGISIIHKPLNYPTHSQSFTSLDQLQAREQAARPQTGAGESGRRHVETPEELIRSL